MSEEWRKSLERIRHEADQAITDLCESLEEDVLGLVEDARAHLDWIIDEVDRLVGPREVSEAEPLA